MQVTGDRWVNGFLMLSVRQDNLQGQKGGVNANDGGIVDLKVGWDNNKNKNLWIENFNGKPALVTHFITEKSKAAEEVVFG